MARRIDKRFLTEHVDEVQSDETDLIGAESLVGDDAWLDVDWLDPDRDAEELNDEEDEEDVLIIEVELFDDDDELCDTEE